MDALVTGGTGFVGANLVRELLVDGRTVRVLARPGSDRRALEGCRVEIAEGDLLDRDSLRAAVAGARRVYHVAADYRLWARDPEEIVRNNVAGARAQSTGPVRWIDQAQGLRKESHTIIGHKLGKL